VSIRERAHDGRGEVVVEVEVLLELWYRVRFWLSGVLYDAAYALVAGHVTTEERWDNLRWWVADKLNWLGVHIQPYYPLSLWQEDLDREDEFEDMPLEDLLGGLVYLAPEEEDDLAIAAEIVERDRLDTGESEDLEDVLGRFGYSIRAFEDEDDGEGLDEDDWFQYVQAEFPPVKAEDLR
jgi:hypothetical protein